MYGGLGSERKREREEMSECPMWSPSSPPSPSILPLTQIGDVANQKSTRVSLQHHIDGGGVRRELNRSDTSDVGYSALIDICDSPDSLVASASQKTNRKDSVEGIISHRNIGITIKVKGY